MYIANVHVLLYFFRSDDISHIYTKNGLKSHRGIVCVPHKSSKYHEGIQVVRPTAWSHQPSSLSTIYRLSDLLLQLLSHFGLFKKVWLSSQRYKPRVRCPNLISLLIIKSKGVTIAKNLLNNHLHGNLVHYLNLLQLNTTRTTKI